MDNCKKLERQGGRMKEGKNRRKKWKRKKSRKVGGERKKG
jgi:hypothetical protein